MIVLAKIFLTFINSIVVRLIQMQIRLNPQAQIQHNRLIQLEQNNQQLKFKLKKCQDWFISHSLTSQMKIKEIEQLEQQLKTLQSHNKCKQEEEGCMIKQLQQIQEGFEKRDKKMKELMIGNQKIQEQRESINKRKVELDGKKKQLQQKMRGKQALLERTESQIRKYNEEGQQNQSKIDDLQKKIQKLERIIKQYQQ